MYARCLAPARIHTLISSLIFWKRDIGAVNLLLQTLALRSFQISHAVRTTAELRPLELADGEFTIACQ